MQIVVDGLLTNYEVKGDNTNTPLLILHGWGGNLADWREVANDLSSQQRVIILDLPGFGQTTQPKTTWSIYDYADFIAKFLKKIDINTVNLMGHSFGGRISIILAAQNKIKINKLILVDSAGTEPQPKLYNMISKVIKPIIKSLPNTISQKVVNRIASKDYLEAGSMKNIFVKVVNEDLSHLLPQIKHNTLIIWGSKDSELDVNLSKEFRDKIERSKIKIIWGADHWPHISHKKEFLECTRKFLND